MNGQWIGPYAGSSSGLLVVNVDRRPTCYEGVAYLNESDPSIPSTAAFFKVPIGTPHFSIRTEVILPISPVSGLPTPWEDIKSRFADGIQIPDHADVAGSWTDDQLTLSWKTNLGEVGSANLPCSRARQASDLVAAEKSWEEFKQHVGGLEPRCYIFRGQEGPWRLRTSFHRTGRSDLTRFTRDDIPSLHRHLSARTKHIFSLANPDENGAFFNLVQHHGYPTPLLDWTYSPYVAAFFAFRKISNRDADAAVPSRRVRIHVFDHVRWKEDWRQSVMLATSRLHVSISEFIAIENERMIPQQALSTVTNVDDIEAYIHSMEKPTRTYLQAIDLAVSERRRVVADLSQMGITAGSLFPGLDGACEELAQRNFD